ncbi:MAG: hypothetical protein M1817_004463 [Caeruleum heppii]|nr:MAG: hypothetical protein M1817_004463 [Caeruleum heppii]
MSPSSCGTMRRNPVEIFRKRRQNALLEIESAFEELEDDLQVERQEGKSNPTHPSSINQVLLEADIYKLKESAENQRCHDCWQRALAGRPLDNSVISQKAFEDLKTEHQDLTHQYASLKDAHEKLTAKYRGERATIKAWAAWIERHHSGNAGKSLLSPLMVPSSAASHNGLVATAPRTRMLCDTSDQPVTPGGPPNILEPHGQAPINPANGVAPVHPPVTPSPYIPISLNAPYQSPYATVPRTNPRSPSVHDMPQPTAAPSIQKAHDLSSIASSPLQDPSVPSARPSSSPACCPQEAQGDFRPPMAMPTDADTQQTEGEPPILKHMPAGSRHPASPLTDAATDDTPVVVSERSVKRKRAGPETARNGPQGSKAGIKSHPISIKSEPGSSSPLTTAGIQDPQGELESLDLDDVGQPVKTPKKRRVSRDLASGSMLVPEVDDRPHNISSAKLSELRRQQSLRPCHATPKEDALRIKEDPGCTARSDARSALRPLTPNLRVLPRTDNYASGHRASKGKEDAEAREPWVSHIAEDGQDHTSKADGVVDQPCLEGCSWTTAGLDPDSKLAALLERRVRDKKIELDALKLSAARAESKRKLKQEQAQASRTTINTTPSVVKSTPTSRSAPPKPATNPSGSSSRPLRPLLPATPQSYTGRVCPETDPLPRRPRSHRLQAPKQAGPEHGPLRSRPLHRLTLEDFKINPAYNQGLDYAFVETVRKQETRKKCLQGCTREGCCGDTWRKMIEIGGLPGATPCSNRTAKGDSSAANPNTPNHPPLTAEDEALLLSTYGPSHPLFARPDTVPPAEQQALLLRARTRHLANTHGKAHRHAYPRRTTPPGFWRTEMPSTQEMREDRAEAERVEREKVRERWESALKDGEGGWLFRDE